MFLGVHNVYQHHYFIAFILYNFKTKLCVDILKNPLCTIIRYPHERGTIQLFNYVRLLDAVRLLDSLEYAKNVLKLRTTRAYTSLHKRPITRSIFIDLAKMAFI